MWVAAGVALAGFQPKLQDATTNENEEFLPASADSTKVIDILDERFGDGGEVPILIVYSRRLEVAEGGAGGCSATATGGPGKRLAERLIAV